MVGMLIPASSLNQVEKGSVCEEVEGMGIWTDSASVRVIYASCMERAIAWVEGICSSAWEIENSVEVGGRVSEVQIRRLLRRSLEVVGFCQRPGGQVGAMRAAEKRVCWEALSRCASPLPLASARPRR